MSGCVSQPSPPDSGEYAGTLLDSPAADFHMVDQTGYTISLSDFTGQLVVLTFMDNRCEDTCPLTAVYLRKANQQLGDQAGSVNFLGVNVNQDADYESQDKYIRPGVVLDCDRLGYQIDGCQLLTGDFFIGFLRADVVRGAVRAVRDQMQRY